MAIISSDVVAGEDAKASEYNDLREDMLGNHHADGSSKIDTPSIAVGKALLTLLAQTFTGIKTFASIPLLPASNPTTSNQATRKRFVDRHSWEFLGQAQLGSASDTILDISGLDTTFDEYKITVHALFGGGAPEIMFEPNGGFGGANAHFKTVENGAVATAVTNSSRFILSSAPLNSGDIQNFQIIISHSIGTNAGIISWFGGFDDTSIGGTGFLKAIHGMGRYVIAGNAKINRIKIFDADGDTFGIGSVATLEGRRIS